MTIDDLIAKSKADLAAMTPEDRAAMYAAQRESYLRAEAAFGSDADEAEYRAAMLSGDAERIARAEAAAAARVAAYDAARKGGAE